jgi:hypothetical protein
MCTVSWIHQPNGYQLFCNRDEKLTRKAAGPPAVLSRDGIRFVSPVDGDAGGTWIATNEFGLSLCLLNGRPSHPGSRSRGLLLLDLVSATDTDEILQRASDLDFGCYAPFSLAVLKPGRYAALIRWNGISKTFLRRAEHYMPLISSSFDPDGVEAKRRAEFHRLRKREGRFHAGLLCLFHAAHGDAPNAYSPCMHREDAETVSFTWVRVGEDRAEWLYKPSAPCKYASSRTVTLALRPSS